MILSVSEFENLTDIFPDICLYEVAEREYENGGWTSKAEFCNAYKFDEDGLAQKIQRAANERLWQQEEHETQLLKECAALREQLAAAETQAERFTDENDKIKAESLLMLTCWIGRHCTDETAMDVHHLFPASGRAGHAVRHQ